MRWWVIAGLILAVVIIGIVILAGLGIQDEIPIEKSGAIVADANNQFAFDLYSKLANDPVNANTNLFFSPYSLSSALAIVYEGSRGSTADEIKSVLHYPEKDYLRQGFYQLNRNLNLQTKYNLLRTGNGLWADQSFPLDPGYVETSRRYYLADVKGMDFTGNPQGATGTINQWVNEKTEGKIPILVPPGSIDSSTRLIITNAIYFKGTWKTQFNTTLTDKEDFTTGHMNKIQVLMMRDISLQTEFNYTETPDLQMLELPYTNGTGPGYLTMVIILPKGNNLVSVERSLNEKTLPELRQAMELRHVFVYLPKIHLETDYRLVQTLRSMGIQRAFSSQADFSGLADGNNLFISDVFHKAFIDVNEEGTEATAATAVLMPMGSAAGSISPPPPPVFRADHPFMFLIQDTRSGLILFLGRVDFPQASPSPVDTIPLPYDTSHDALPTPSIPSPH